MGYRILVAMETRKLMTLNIQSGMKFNRISFLLFYIKKTICVINEGYSKLLFSAKKKKNKKIADFSKIGIFPIAMVTERDTFGLSSNFLKFNLS